MEDATTQALEIALPDGDAPLQLTLTPWEAGDGLIVMRVSRAGTEATESPCVSDSVSDTASGLIASAPEASTGATLSARDPASVKDDEDTRPVEELAANAVTATSMADASSTAAGASGDDASSEFRRALVELMLVATEAWERSTGHSRIELAERSRIWTVNVDDGRLRTRAMERYFSLAKLPRNPRWRDVLRTAYFVLGECRLDPQLRDDLQRRVDLVLAFSRRSALI